MYGELLKKKNSMWEAIRPCYHILYTVYNLTLLKRTDVIEDEHVITD